MSHLEELLTVESTPSSVYQDRASSNTSQESQSKSLDSLVNVASEWSGEGRTGPATGTSSRTRRRVACVECRQQKSKCDAYERAPMPCSKCSKKGVPCILKRDYRRTYKRARNEVIERRFKELTENLSKLSSEELLRHIEEDQLVLSDEHNFTLEALSQAKRRRRQQRLDGNGSGSGSGSESEREHGHSIHGDNNNNIREVPNGRSKHLTTSSSLFSDLSMGMTPEELKCEPKTLGDIHMSSEDIADLFQEFATKYHRFLPVVDLHKGSERIYSLSPCLFWVILLIGLRRRENPNIKGNNKTSTIDLMTQLSSLVKAILSEIIISPILRYTPRDTDAPIINVTSVYSVQAFLLYTFWPPLVSSLSADSSWNTISTAMCQAIRIGLNNTYFSKEFVSENAELVSEQRRTWICCNIVSQFIASSFGFPAFVSFDNIVMNSLRADGPESLVIPQQLRQMIQIAFFENQIVSTMSPNLTDGLCSNCPTASGEMEKLSLLNLLSQQLAQLEWSLFGSGNVSTGSVVRQPDDRGPYCDGIRKFLLLSAKVHLLTYYFFESEVKPCFDIKRGLVKAYNASIDLLNHAYEMFSQDSTIIKYFPGVFVIDIWQTACIVGKLAHSSLTDMIDVDRGKAAYKNAVLLTSRASILRYDLAFRSSGIMKSIWRMFDGMYNDWLEKRQAGGASGVNEEEFNLNLTVRSRMSVSVFFDCLYLLRGKCGIARLRREKGIGQSCGAVCLGGSKEYVNTTEGDPCANGGAVCDGQTEAEVEVEVDADTDVESEGPMHYNGMSRKPLATKARHLIETIPLDPVPICADKVSTHIHSSSSRIATPDNLSGGIPGQKTLTNSSNDHNTTQQVSITAINGTPTGTTGTSQLLPAKSKNNQPSLSNIINNDSKPADQLFNLPQSVTRQVPTTTTSNTNTNTITITNTTTAAITPSNDLSAGDNTPISRQSSGTRLWNWENWDSDVIWQDVDLLMNEFAFNPSL